MENKKLKMSENKLRYEDLKSMLDEVKSYHKDDEKTNKLLEKIEMYCRDDKNLETFIHYLCALKDADGKFFFWAGESNASKPARFF